MPREVAAELAGDEQAVSLWRAGEGLRVLLVPPTRVGRAASPVMGSLPPWRTRSSCPTWARG